MNIQTQLLKEHSKKNTLLIADYIGHDKERLLSLWSIIATAAPPLPQRAAWVLAHLLEAQPHLATPIMGDMIDTLKHDHHDAVYRAIVRSLAKQPSIPAEYYGVLYDWAIACLLSPLRAVAIKIHTMDIAFYIAKEVPELQAELKEVIEDQYDFGSAGFKSKAKKILKQLKL